MNRGQLIVLRLRQTISILVVVTQFAPLADVVRGWIPDIPAPVQRALAQEPATPPPDGPTATDAPTIQELFQQFYDDLDSANSAGQISSNGVYNSLLTKAQNAETSVSQGNYANALSKLNALLNELQAAAGNQVGQPDADILIDDVLAMLGAVEGQATGTPTATDTPSSTPTDTPTATATETSIATPSETPSPTETETPSVTPSAPPTGTETANPTQTPSATPSGTAMPLSGDLSFEVSVFPQVVSAGEEATVTALIVNHSQHGVTDVRLRDKMPAGLIFSPSAGGGGGPRGGISTPNHGREVEVEPGTGHIISRLDTLAAGESVTLVFKVKATPLGNKPASAMTDVLQLSAAGLDVPLVAEINLMVLPPGAKSALVGKHTETHFDTGRVSLDIPVGAARIDRGVVFVTENDQSSLLTEFDLDLLADPGTKRLPLPQAVAAVLNGKSPFAPNNPAQPSSAVSASISDLPGMLLPESAFVGSVSSQDTTPTDTPEPTATETVTPEPTATETPTSEATPSPQGTGNPERPDLALSDVLDEERILVDESGDFEKPYTLTVDLDGLANLTTLPLDTTPFVAVYAPDNDNWVRQPLSRVDRADNTLTLESSHFSTWGAGLGGTFPTNGTSIPLYDEAAVSTFTGRASYGYPLWVPAGRGDMAPQLALSYASGSVDGILGDVQSSWVGMGWNIDSAEITRKVLNGGCDTNCGSGLYGYENEFVLALNGTSYKLYPDPAAPGRYQTEENAFLYIQRHNVNLNNEEDGTTEPINATKEWWEVYTSDGTRYRFGWNVDSEQLAAMKGYTPSLGGAWTNLGYAGAASHRVAQRWRLDKAMDVFGNTIAYSYDEDSRNVAGKSVQYDTESFPDKILYTGTNKNACNPSNETCTEVRFITAARATDYDLPASGDILEYDTWDKKYLDKVEVYQRDNGGDTLLRTYDLTLSEVNRSDSDGDTNTWDSLVLDSIVTIAPDSLAAPKVTFDYANYDNRAPQTGQAEWAYPRLIGLHNGTGGAVAFHFTNDNRPATQYYAWRVDWREVSDGVTIDKRRSEYTYDLPCYDDPLDEENGWCNYQLNGGLVGHQRVIETVKNFNGSTLASYRHDFHTTKEKVGREHNTDSRDASGTIVFRSQTDYAVFDHDTTPAYPEDVYFTYASQTRSYELQGASLKLVNKTIYTYDDDYGRLVTQQTYDGSSDLYTTTNYAYVTDNPTDHLHSFPRSTITLDADSNVISASYSAYDGTTGALGTGACTWNSGTSTWGGACGLLTLSQTRTLADATQTMDATYAYDQYGNQTVTHAHSQYGTLNTAPSSHADDRETTVTYDDYYHLYPKIVTNALLQKVQTTYDFEITNELPLGLPRKVSPLYTGTTAPADSEWSKTIYDKLGRAIEMWQPTATQANVKTVYPTLNGSGQIAAPYTIKLQIYDDGGPWPGGTPEADKYREAWAFYDGLGRILRTVGPAETSGQYIQSDTAFNALGLADKSTRPYTVNLATPPGTYSAPSWSTLKTTIVTYDSFGRTLQVTAPDGNTVKTQYGGRSTTVIDPNGHKKVSTLDDFGRLIEIEEFSGSGFPGDPYADYAKTTYAYDARGLLATVTDDQNNVTSLEYDGLGRKTEMDDPDMGVWTYTYDIWGQLDTQTDARTAQIRFTYDKLGRVMTREARPDNGLNTAWDMVAEYTYDSTADGNHGLGRLTQSESVFDANDLPTVIDDITYDVLGRVTEATRTIDEVAYTTASTYDSLGRILTMTLPTGEELTTTYNARGLFESLHGDNTFADDEYVTSTDYTPAGGIDAQTLGNGVMTDFRYDETSNRLARLLTGRPAFVPLVDQAYTYDSAGNITGLDDGVRDETNTYEYDFLNRLIYADVFAGPQLVERRSYAYDTIGNIIAFSRAFPAAGEGTGFFKVGGLMDSAVYDARADFNPFAAMHRTGTAINGDGVSYFVTGRVGPNAAPVASGMRLQGSFYPGVYASSSLYEGPQGINPLTGRDGVTAFARGVTSGGSGSGGYTGPYGEEYITYTYGENGAGPHAVTSRDISDTTSDDAFEYDENGNMTVRTQDGVTYCQTFDAENRLVTVETLSSGTCDSKVVATEVRYVYDGGGARIKKIVDDATTTLYVAGMEIETQTGVTGSKKTIYYPAGGAFRVINTLNGATDNDVFFRHSDHLGSTSVLSDFDGDKVANSDVVYAPFGEVRDGPESDLTDFGYTGQRRDGSTGGLMYYGARYYLPGIMRFISADTVTPGMSSQYLNRYSYVNNNPINFIDPTGHNLLRDCVRIDGGECRDSGWTADPPNYCDTHVCEGSSGGCGAACPPTGGDDWASGGLGGGGDGEEELACILHDYSCYQHQQTTGQDGTYNPSIETNFQVTELAFIILQHPNADPWQKYWAFWWISANTGASVALLGGLAILGGAAVYYGWQAIVSAGTAACSDGDCQNEASYALNQFKVKPLNQVNTPPTPGNINIVDFGEKVIKWKDAAGNANMTAALDRINTVTAVEMQRWGVTSSMAQEWGNFYLGKIVTGSAQFINTTALGRAELMYRIAEMLAP